MRRVFVFCVGGTGLRVMKSVIMLIGAGMDTHGFTVVPILIDPHMDLEEKRNLQTLIHSYEQLHEAAMNSTDGKLDALKGFFGVEVKDLSQLTGETQGNFEPIQEKRSFGQFLNAGCINTGDINQFLLQTLFSQDNLDNSLSVGFKGSPNVGTVVLGELIKEASWFQAFCNHCQQGDRVFIISSIFGGTGASGYPLLERTIRNAKDHPNVKDAFMGAVSVLPYFALSDASATDSDIESANFLTKTKSALAYYENNVKSDCLYYIGEQSMKTTYANDEQKQEDHAHFVELVAATALFDFLSKENKPLAPTALSRSILEESDSLSLKTLGKEYGDIIKAVADMTLLRRLVSFLPDEHHFPLSIDRGFNDLLYKSSQMEELRKFLIRFSGWYKELSNNHRAFAPLNVPSEDNRSATLINLVADTSIEAKDESYLLLEMIRAGNRDKSHHTNPFRRFLDYSYQAIDKYTSKILI